MKKLISLFLVLFISLSVVLPVKASAAGLEWFELLDHYTLTDDGLNSFQYTTTTTIDFPLSHYTHVNKVDVLLYHSYGTAPTKVEVYDKSTWRTLTIQNINDSITRVYGDVGGAMFSSLQLRFTKSGTSSSYVELKSFKIYTLPTTYSSVNSTINYVSPDASVLLTPGTNKTIAAAQSEPHYSYNYTVTASVSNAGAFDFANMSFVTTYASITSISVRYGGHYVPFECSFVDTESKAFWENSVDTGEADFSGEYGNYYCSLSVDLSGIDRTKNSSLDIVITGLYSTAIGMSVKITDLVAGLIVPDQTDAHNWVRFKNFISEQFTSLGSTLSTGFSNVSSWISSQTSTLKTQISTMQTTLNNTLTTIKNSVSTGFTNVGTWITNQTTTLKNTLDTGFSNLDTWIDNQTGFIQTSLVYVRETIQLGFDRVGNWFKEYFGVKDQDAIDDLSQSSGSISQGASDIHDFEQSQQDTLNTGFATIQSAVTFTNFATALVFVQKYANMTINGISDYTIVFTLPLFLGLFFYLCSRVPGVTRWKSRPPKSKGGGSP